ncbi:triose-phosphate isomerase [Aquibaculum arenosum]|uniref:Triosephosphate isomerase n=1 Tax=Aquibaculum arenosum TaxID=3032591 RepID=A0ABT5YPV1_9PROT|nr:triose-phosphate isomerase [Fodinicurvata sp. CAU 1616]MDF2096821.1 triose-phosphate isomerase [Fodinicurvata sp. CAU 1616]
MRRKLIAGNWKMNGLSRDGLALAEALAGKLEEARLAGTPPSCDLLICPPFVLLPILRSTASDAEIAMGGQDCHAAESGAHTGDTSAAMLADVGCSFVLVGHSERRQDHGERSKDVAAKASTALSAGLTPVICVGETREERDAGRALDVIESQVRDSLPSAGGSGEVVLAYEPVWAIGTGLTATSADVAEVHGAIRKVLADLRGDATAQATRILYGGSVKPANAAELLGTADVDGALVGGASLKAEDFWAIATACP